MCEREKRVRLMENGEVNKTLITLGIPSIIAMIITAIYNFVDTLFIGMLNDTIAMSAVSIAFPILMILSSIGQLVGVGASSYTSRMLGNKRNDLANKAASISIVLSIIFTIITMTLGLIFLDDILKLVGASESVLPVAGKYVRWIIIGSIFTITNSIFTITNNLKIHSLVIVIQGIFNILIVYLLMKTTQLGILAIAGVSSITAIILNLVYTPIYAAHCLKCSKNIFYPVIIRYILSTVLLVVVLSLVATSIKIDTWIELVFVTIFCGLIGVIVNGCCLLEKKEREYLLSLFSQKFHKQRA